MASYYGVTYPEYWTGPTGRAIRRHGGKNAQLLGLYLTSNRFANMLGLYRLLPDDVEHETGLKRRDLARAYAVVGEVDFAEFDAVTSFVWVHTMARFRLALRPGQALKRDDLRVKAINRIYHALDDNPFLGRFYDTYRAMLCLQARRQPGGSIVPLSIVDGDAVESSHAGPVKGLASPLRAASPGSSLQGSSKGLASQMNRSVDLDPFSSNEVHPPPEIEQINREQGSEIRSGSRSEGQDDCEDRDRSDSRARERARPPTPTRTAFERYHQRFLGRYRARPEYGHDQADHDKHAGNMARLLRKHGVPEVLRRIDAFFDSADPYLQHSGHSLGLFFSSDVQTKLVAHLSEPLGTLMSNTMRHNLAAAAEAKRLVMGKTHG